MTKFFVIILTILLMCTNAFSEDVGKVTYVEGRVDIFNPDSEIGSPLVEDEAVSIGDAIRTKSNSKAEIEFKDKSILRLAQNSKVEIEDYQLDKDNRRKRAAIKLERGKARAIIAKGPDSSPFDISTPNAKGTVKGSDIFTFYQAGSTNMLVAEGKLSIANIAHPEDTLVVPSGNSVLVQLEGLPKGPRPYFELEKKFHEDDTNVPVIIPKGEANIIKGAVTRLSGDVKIQSKGSSAPHEAKLNEIVEAGDAVETGPNGMIEIKFENGNAINLKQSTKFKILKLLTNPKTGEYENSFEASMGKVRARIERLEGKSRFEVKTPTAVCGARGTIMYLEILLNMTRSFFEGGAGFMTNLVSGETTNLGAGENALSDASGATSNPVPTSDEERMNFGEGWDPGSGVEGYSSPEGSAGEYLFDSDTGTDTGAGGDTDTPDTGGAGGEYIDVPITQTPNDPTQPLAPTTPAENPPSPPIEPQFSGLTAELEGNFGHPGSSSGAISATLNDDSTFLSDAFSLGAENFIQDVINFFVNPEDNESFLTVSNGAYSNPDGASTWFGGISGQDSNGGAFQGWAGGTWHSWEGGIASLFIDPVSGKAGTMLGYLSGETGQETFEGFGDVFMIAVEDAGITPQELANSLRTTPDPNWVNLSGVFGDGGAINGDFERETITINGKSWGIWRDIYSDLEYDNPGLPEWFAVAGGTYNEEEDGYYFSAIFGEDLNGGFQSYIFGSYLDFHKLGAYFGFIFGTGDEGIGVGAFVEEELSSSGSMYNTINQFGRPIGNFGGFSEDRNEGPIGIVGPIWGDNAAPRLVSIGDFYVNEDEPFLWHSGNGDRRDGENYFYSYNPDAGTYTAYGDGGAFYGITGGIGNRGTLEGLALALYIDPDGNVGILRGEINGAYSNDIQMYLLSGELTNYLKARDIGIAPEDLIDRLNWEDLSAKGVGGFKEGENISGNMTVTEASGIALSIDGQPWGIWGIDSYGTYSGGGSTWRLALGGSSVRYEDDERLEEGDGYFLCTIKGTESSNDRLRGTPKGVWFAQNDDSGKIKAGIISGETIGNYIDVDEEGVGRWQAVSGGDWVEVTELLEPEQLGFTLADLQQFVSVPITEVYSNVLSGSNSFINTATMDISLYQNEIGRFWAALFEGPYSGEPANPNEWSLTLNDENDIVTLSGKQWSDNKWLADVNGTVDGNSIAGQAGGPYGDGKFSGVGAGPWGNEE